MGELPQGRGPEVLRPEKLGIEWPSHHTDAQSNSEGLPQGTLKFPIYVFILPLQVAVSQ